MGRPRKLAVESIETSAESVERPTAAQPRSRRRARTPINGYRDKLSVKGQEAGFHYCWVTDENVDEFLESDYDFVTHDVIVGTKRVNAGSGIGGHISLPGGNGVTLFLMRVPVEYHQEDMDHYHGNIDESEESMKQALNSKDDGRYGKVEVEVNNKTRP